MLLSAMGIAAAQQRRRAGAAKVNRLMMYLLLINVPRKVGSSAQVRPLAALPPAQGARANPHRPRALETRTAT